MVFDSTLEVRSLVVTIAFFLREPRETSPNGASRRYQGPQQAVNPHGAFRRSGRAAGVVVVTVLAYGSASALAAHPSRRKSPTAPALVSLDTKLRKRGQAVAC